MICPWCVGKVRGIVHTGRGQLWWTSCGHLVIVVARPDLNMVQLERPGV